MTGRARDRRLRSMCVYGQRGLAIVEFTIATPVLFLLLYAISEFGSMLYQYALLADAARNADRYLGANAISTGNGIPVITSTVAGATCNLVVYGYISSVDSSGRPRSPILPGLAVGQVTVATQRDASGATDVTVSVAYPYQSLFGGSMLKFVSAGTLNTALTLNVFTSMRPL